MKRKYTNTETKTDANYFYGVEVEHSPAHGLQTLFVTGIHQVSEILTYAKDVKHIYCGANQSFNPTGLVELTEWFGMVNELLEVGFWVTLDFDIRYAKDLVENGLSERNRFIPMVSVKLPYISQFNYNTTIKIDDVGFEATNAGVWCHRLHNLMAIDKFTSWDKYNDDKVIK